MTDEKPSPLDQARFVMSADFVNEILLAMDVAGVDEKKIESDLGLEEGAIRGVFSHPESLSMEMVVKLTEALGLRCCLVTYKPPVDLAGLDHTSGDLSPQEFRRSWEAMGCPTTIFELEDAISRRWDMTCGSCQHPVVVDSIQNGLGVRCISCGGFESADNFLRRQAR